MGADLIGYLVVGPMEISQEQRDAAVKHLNKLKPIAQRFEALDIDTNNEKVGEHLEVFDEDWMKPLLDGIDVPSDWDEDLQRVIGLIALCAPEADVDFFIAWWHSPGARDTVSRETKDRSQQIVFSGDRSWGE